MKKDLEKLTKLPPWEWPEDADEVLIHVLGDKKSSTEDRKLAAELSGEFVVINEALAETLLSILRDSKEDVGIRSSAAISFGPALEHGEMVGFDDPEDILLSEETLEKVQKTLRKLYMDPDLDDDLRRSLLEASVRVPKDWHHKEVRVAWASQDEQWKRTAVFCMRFLPGFEDLIEDALKSKNPEIYYQAIHAAGVWEVEAAWPHVKKILKTPKADKSLLLAAITASAFIKPDLVFDLLEPFMDSEDEEIEEAVEEALIISQKFPMDDEDYEDYDDFDEDDDDFEDDDSF